MRNIKINGLRLVLCLVFGIGSLPACIDKPEPGETEVAAGTNLSHVTETATTRVLNNAPEVFTATTTVENSSLVFSTSTPTIERDPTPENISPNPDLIWDLIGKIDRERVLTDLRFLTGIEPICTQGDCYTITNRETESKGLKWAREYVYEELNMLGYSVERLDWSLEGYSDQNLVARSRGVVSPDKEIYFVAHLDGIDSPAADDDASGVVSLLELARVINQESLKNSVVLLFTTGEEQGALGARSYVNQLNADQLKAIQYVISVEMLSYDSNNDGVMQLWSGDQQVDFVQELSEVILTYEPGLRPQIVTGCG